MIIDVTGIELTPGNHGKDCAGNGEGDLECCCDECDYFLCCYDYLPDSKCEACSETECPRHPSQATSENERI